jgi:peptidoglycan/xylan/chitin deacetylase (PgdA/CDA1 family)
MYHRVAEPLCDPWELAVSLHHFDQQMQILREVRRPLSMQQFVDGLRLGNLPERAVAVTFDDGYVDNLVNAKPTLERYGIPATIFLATGEIGQRHEYWWDELARLILQSKNEIHSAVFICGERIPITLESRDGPAAIGESWRASEPPRRDSEQLYLSLWGRLRILTPAGRENVLGQLRMIFNSGAPDPWDFPMSKDDVRTLRDGGTFSVGAHTVSHPMLSSLPPEERAQEIRQSRTDCEALVGVPIEGFAYPYGDCDPAIQGIVSDAGYRWACSTRSDRVRSANFDPFELPRMQVGDWNAVQFEKWLG